MLRKRWKNGGNNINMKYEQQQQQRKIMVTLYFFFTSINDDNTIYAISILLIDPFFSYYFFFFFCTKDLHTKLLLLCYYLKCMQLYAKVLNWAAISSLGSQKILAVSSFKRLHCPMGTLELKLTFKPELRLVRLVQWRQWKLSFVMLYLPIIGGLTTTQ